jgi:glycosyltransferase involved in cell wall biosynthesis
MRAPPFTILSDARWKGFHGIGRFACEVLRRLPEHVQLENGPKPLSITDPLWLTWQVIAKRPSVFFSPGFNPPLLCSAPFVFTIHDLMQIQVPDVATASKRLYYELVLKPAARRAHSVLTVSEYSRSQILRWSGLPEERVVNVGNGVDAPFVPGGPRYEPGFRYILYVGNFRPHKNLFRLLTAFRDLDCPGLRLLLIGTPTREVSARLGEIGLRPRTAFLSALPDQDLASVYRGALLLVLPSLIEGFGLPALEAMACGTPVVVSRSTALPEVVGKAGLLVDPLDTHDIKQAMERVLGDGDVRATMREMGLARAKQFSWDQVAARVRTVLYEARDARS